MSKHNRERKLLWRLGLHKKQLGRKLKGSELAAAVEYRKRRLGMIR